MPNATSKNAMQHQPNALPWAGKVSLYQHIRTHLDPTSGALCDTGFDLPDDEERFGGERIRWAPGALEGAFSPHAESEEARQTRLAEILDALTELTRHPSETKRARVYETFMADDTLGFIDPLLQALAQNEKILLPRLYHEAHWMASAAAHRGVVKAGIALLGLFDTQENTELLMTLGKHDEFTLYAMVALANTLRDPEERFESLWQLAKSVKGWGKIHLVERLVSLPQAQREDFKAWLLRYGCENEVMDEYLAYACAVCGELEEALEAEAIDEELLAGAAIIISALIHGGPAEDMTHYEEGAAATERFLYHFAKRAQTLRDFYTAKQIYDFINEEEQEWAKLAERGWTPEKRSLLSAQCEDILRDPKWPPMILQALDDPRRRALACAAAHHLQLDVWEKLFAQLKAAPQEPSLYYELMQTREAHRIDRVVTFAAQALPLDEIASGPANELFGAQPHQCLDFILQELGKFPGLGWPLLEAGLRSPVVRHRHWVLNVLKRWGKHKWPQTAWSMLQSALTIEPEEKVKEHISQLLSDSHQRGEDEDD